MKTKNTVKPYSHKYVDCNGMIVVATVDLKVYLSSALNPFPLAHFDESAAGDVLKQCDKRRSCLY